MWRLWGVGLVAVLASGCFESMGKKVVAGALDETNQKQLTGLASQIGHDATASLMTTMDGHLKEQLGPTIRDELQKGVQAAIDKLLADGNRGRLRETFRSLVVSTIQELGNEVDKRVRGQLGDALAATIRERIAPEIESS